ncbi:hypothetical protein VSDG_06722 [Cytospora chrysosperma]|uniref:Cytochrome P450 n=1 Tax=Cytospora chrysosperma TaxID=252740 RepID=A0A423VNA8_CYTCH|nr:hypothetical protein VSDG_06722 [Valsa sordida]
MTGSANLVLPPSLLHLVNQPDRGFLAFNAFSDKFQFRYMINDPDVWHNVLQFEVIRRKFSRQERIVPLASYTAEELQFAFHGVWGDDLQWSDLNGCDTSGRIIAQERIQIWRERKGENDEPTDFLEWFIAKCAATGPEQMDPKKIALRLLHLATPFIFAMGSIFAQCCQRVSSKQNGFPTKASVDELFRVDSALRESMRLSDVSVTALPRDVVSAAGLSLGNGITMSKGTRCVFPTQPIHLNEEYYMNPNRYDAFRFSRPSEGSGNEKPTEERQLATSITESLLAFGYGRHACRGHFFASQTLKQALAHMLLNYDVEMTPTPPAWQCHDTAN